MCYRSYSSYSSYNSYLSYYPSAKENPIMKTILIAAALFASPALFAATDVPLKNGWQFSKDSISWQSVSIPHDWAIYGPFSRDNDLQKVVVEQNGEKEATKAIIKPPSRCPTRPAKPSRYSSTAP